MILISHRGNINGLSPERENTKQFIQEAIDLGYDVEIDVRMIDGKLFLGHDGPEYDVDLDWLAMRSKKLWIHAKNFNALEYLLGFVQMRVFYHQFENHTIIGNTQYIWSHEINEASHRSIIPLLSMDDIMNASWNYTRPIHGVCSDFVDHLKNENK